MMVGIEWEYVAFLFLSFLISEIEATTNLTRRGPRCGPEEVVLRGEEWEDTSLLH